MIGNITNSLPVLQILLPTAYDSIIASMNQEEIDLIDEAINEISMNGRADVLERVSLLIDNEMIGDDRVWAIRTIAEILPEERDVVVELANRLILDGMSGEDKIAIIESIAGVNRDERENVWSCISLFITAEMDAEGICSIIEAVADVGSNERENVLWHARQLIAFGMNGGDVAQLIRDVAAIDIEQRAGFVENHLQRAATEVDVHEENRDARTREALELLYQRQSSLVQEEIVAAKDAFIQYLETVQMDERHEAKRELARDALLAPRIEGEQFGALIDSEIFTVLGLQVSGEELIGRLWIFASQLDEPEQSNAKWGMISGLAASYNDFGQRVCNPGKVQQLVVAVLQGRLEGAIVDNGRLTVHQAVNIFLSDSQEIDTLHSLLEAAEAFLQQNSDQNLDRELFLQEVRRYADLSGIV